MHTHEETRLFSKPRLGVVDPEGIIRYSNSDINECRGFLRSLNMDVSITGWSSENGFKGSLEHDNGKWHANAWKSEGS